MTADLREDADQFIAIARTHWLDTGTGHRLHAVLPGTWTAEHREDMAADWVVQTPVRLACGRTVSCVAIPGPFTRMGAMRCKGCCRATGFPQGKGAPKNDAACRQALGLDAA